MTQALEIRAIDKRFDPGVFGRCELHRAVNGVFDNMVHIFHSAHSMLVIACRHPALIVAKLFHRSKQGE